MEKSYERSVKRNNERFTAVWWREFFIKALIAMATAICTVSTIGVLAIPVVLSIFYTPLCVLIYLIYPVILLLVAAVALK